MGTDTPYAVDLKRRLLRRAVTALLTAALIVMAYLSWRDTALFGTVEGQTLTWRFQSRGMASPPDDVIVIAIDNATMTRFKRWPLPRRVLAEAVERLAGAQARVIGLDLLLPDSDPSIDATDPSAGDAALAAALAKIPSVLPLAFTFGQTTEMDLASIRLVRQASFSIVHHIGESGPAIDATGVIAPLDSLRNATNLGHVNVLADQDGVLRQLYLAIEVGGRYVPSFPIEIARHYFQLPRDRLVLSLARGISLGDYQVPADRRLQMPVLYYGPPKTIPTYSFSDLLDGLIPPQRLSDRIVLIGATATGVGDTFVTPFSRSFPGVEALATATSNIVHGQVLIHDSRSMRWDLVAIIGSCLAAFLIGYLPVSIAPAAALAGLAVLIAGLAQWLFQTHLLWLNVTFPIIGIVVSSGYVATSRVVWEHRSRRDMEWQKSNLARYHSPVVADLLARSHPDSAGHRQMAAILFVDMAGFTSRSERLSPEDAAQFLREFHGRIERSVLAHGGMLDQFLGDGAMVIFGVRAPSPEDPVAALSCARRLVSECEAWSRQLVSKGHEPLVIRIGIHYGIVVISQLGGSMQMHFSAAGDTVNVAARLEAFGRASSSTISISGPVANAVCLAGRQDLLAGFSELPPQPIRGRTEKLSVWTLRQQPL